MRYEFRENHDGKEIYDSQEGYYMDDDECLQQLNDQAAEIKERTGGKTMKRYRINVIQRDSYKATKHPQKHKLGGWCKWEDVKELVAEIELLKKLRKREQEERR